MSYIASDTCLRGVCSRPTRLLSRLLFLFAFSAAVQAQSCVPLADIRDYIHNSWKTLTRSNASLSDSAIDSKVAQKGPIILWVASDEDAARIQRELKVIVHKLSSTQESGLLYLPNPYVVPGGRFNEMYGWDSYFILLGLVADKKADHVILARGMVENFFFEIENYGAILNANRTYFFTRSQPPLLSSMIREVYEHPAGAPLSKEWLAKAYGYAERDYALWTHAPHLAGMTGLARYEDIGAGPVPEMADDSDYYPDVIRWLLAHPEVHTDYLIEAPDDPNPAEAVALAKSSCDMTASKVCARAHV